MKTLVTLLFLLFAANMQAQREILRHGKRIALTHKNIYVNPKEKSNAKAHTYNNVNDALKHVEKYQQEHPEDTIWTTVYIEPSVYWIDNPDDTTTKVALPGDYMPFGIKLKLSKVRLVGLSGSPSDVVLASQRGQTAGAIGNFTMMHITGDDIMAENITFGNYCNVDLVYPLDTRLNRKKKTETIVQAQLVICNGKGYKARNCNFISRLNLCPFAGAKDATFENCYFECTDDALCGTGKYLGCRFTFFSSKPFYTTSKDGAYFKDCHIHSKTKGIQYLAKVSGPVTMEGCHWTSDDKELKIEWAPKPNPKHKCYMTGCTLNGKPLLVPVTPDIPMPVGSPYMPLTNKTDIEEGKWTADAHCPSDLGVFSYEANRDIPAWAFGEGVDGAEGICGLVQNTKGARLMYTGISEEKYENQTLTLLLDPCKAPGQGFGSATGQYLDVCIKFDTKTLTGFGIRFVRTVNYDKAVEVMLLEYSNGTIKKITAPTRCDIFKRGCMLTLSYCRNTLKALIQNGTQSQTLECSVAQNAFGGIHIQHTGSTGASATVIRNINCSYK